MKFRFALLAIASIAILCASPVSAQLQIPAGHYLLPANPTSADNVMLSLADPFCERVYRYRANPYRLAMLQNSITVTLGERNMGPSQCVGPPREEIDLGRLPAGNYTVTVNLVVSEGIATPPLFTNVPFTVTDARATKAAPYVRVDYSGHWWDPNDSGWGLFIWHDARSPADSIFAAWFTYSPDGKPMWVVFQPTWKNAFATAEVSLVQTSRPPGTSSPPPNPTNTTVAGSASLDFSNLGTIDEGKLTYTFTGGAKQTRTIRRFRP